MGFEPQIWDTTKDVITTNYHLNPNNSWSLSYNKHTHIKMIMHDY